MLLHTYIYLGIPRELFVLFDLLIIIEAVVAMGASSYLLITGFLGGVANAKLIYRDGILDKHYFVLGKGYPWGF